MEEIPVEGKMGGRIAMFSYLKVASTWMAFRGTSNCTVVLGHGLTRLKSLLLNIKHVAATLVSSATCGRGILHEHVLRIHHNASSFTRLGRTL